jgi:CHAT domain/SIR2-like domain
MKPLIDLEYYIFPSPGEGTYQLSINLSNPYVANFAPAHFTSISLDLDKLDETRKEQKWREYGRILSENMFGAGNGVALESYRAALIEARNRETLVRFRLSIDEGVRELQLLAWELLLDSDPNLPADDVRCLVTNPSIVFSRSITGGRSREISLREKFQIRALVFIANPKPPLGLNLPPIDVEKELAQARDSLGDISITAIRSTTQKVGEATVDNLFWYLDHGFDVLYLMCHGRIDRSNPERTDAVLYLEDSAGNMDLVRGTQFIAQIDRLTTPPNLVLLISCQGAGDPNAPDRVSAALGPRLTRAGVPAVLAMRGNLPMSTAEKFLPILLGSLRNSGVIDTAVADARKKLGQEAGEDVYAPVLFHRLKNGQLWYANDNADGAAINLTDLVRHIKNGEGTVVLGSGLIEPYIGTQSELAERLATKGDYRFAEKYRQDLALVTQYICHADSRRTVELAYLHECALQLLRVYGDELSNLLPGTVKAALADPVGLETKLHDLILAVWRKRRLKYAKEPHNLIAKMPFRAYITTNPDGILEEALRENKNLSVWRSGRNCLDRDIKLAPGLPTKLDPLLAYVYGSFQEPSQLVLTEDDYFKYLYDMATDRRTNISQLNNIYIGSALVLLGFRLHEWDFRVFFRRLKQISGWERHEDFSHVAVQIDPSSAGGSASSDQVRRYLGDFIHSSKIRIFEGSVDDFVRTLYDRVMT